MKTLNLLLVVLVSLILNFTSCTSNNSKLDVNKESETMLIEKDSSLSIEIVDVISCSCYGTSNGRATVNILNGTPPYSYYWDNTWANPTNDYLTAGTHSVTVTDANGSQAITNVIVTEPHELMVAGNNIVDVNCTSPTSGAIDLVVVGGTLPYSYHWNNGDATASISNLTVGNYSVTVTDANGCIYIDNITILSQPTVIMIISIPDTIHTNEPPIDLQSFVMSSPSGSNYIFTGYGVLGTKFCPNKAHEGNNIITIQCHDPYTGCVISEKHNIYVY